MVIEVHISYMKIFYAALAWSSWLQACDKSLVNDGKCLVN
jgi:hypothetical protein